MELDDLIIVWKKQDENVSLPLEKQTLRYLLKQKSQGALSKIRRRLTGELIVIIIVFTLFNILFILVKLPYTYIRSGSFVAFNVILLWYLYYYSKAAFLMFKLKYNEDLTVNIERIVKNLDTFCNQYKLLNLPVGFLCIVMFAGSQNLLILVPWMVIEFLWWRSVLLPKLVSRFEGYKADLEYSLRSLQELDG